MKNHHITSICAKSLALTAVLALALTALTGCGKKSDDKTFRVGLDSSYPPMEFKDQSGAIVGFDVDMDKEIARRLGREYVSVETNFDGIWQALNTDKFDVAVSSCSITKKRLQNFLFSKPYIANEQVIIAKKDLASKLRNLEDLKGMRVAVQVGTTADIGCQKLLKEKPDLFTLVSYPEATRALDDLGLDRVQVVVIDSVVGLYYVALNKEQGFACASASLPPEPIGMAFRLGDNELRDKVDKILNDMRADGTMKAISQRWFNADLVSNVKEEYPEGD